MRSYFRTRQIAADVQLIGDNVLTTIRLVERMGMDIERWRILMDEHVGARRPDVMDPHGRTRSKPCSNAGKDERNFGLEWLPGSRGARRRNGDALFYGSMGETMMNAPIVGIAATPTGKGHCLVGADGGLFTFGDAPFDGPRG